MGSTRLPSLPAPVLPPVHHDPHPDEEEEDAGVDADDEGPVP